MTKRKRSDLQNLVDSYLTSGLSGNEYINSCVESGEMNITEAINTLSMLQDNHTLTFKLSEINRNDKMNLEMILSHKLSEKKTLAPPLFHIKFDSSLNAKKKEVIKLVQDFSKSLALLATQEAYSNLPEDKIQEEQKSLSYEPLKKYRLI